jgi:hypothetical protein
MKRFLGLALAAVASLAALPARALPPVPWDGTEPKEFTHYVDHDGDGRCDNLDKRPGADQLKRVTNGIYPDCDLGGGKTQVAHGHWEYVHTQGNPQNQGRDTEEKDYADVDLADPSGWADAGVQSYRFLNNEPTRFLRLFAGPMRYWQVDEWIGPRAGDERLPFATWNERFFACSSPCTAGGASGGYWSDQLAPVAPVRCYAKGARTDQCGMKG